MNEPRVIGSATEWSGGTPEERDVINQLYQAFIDTVRATGGLNADRTLIISSHAQSITKEAVSAVKIPDDAHIAVSIHSYAPWDFCGTDDTRSDWGSDADKQELDTNFQYLEDTSARAFPFCWMNSVQSTKTIPAYGHSTTHIM